MKLASHFMSENESYCSYQITEKFFPFSQYILKLFCLLNLLIVLYIAQKHNDLGAIHWQLQLSCQPSIMTCSKVQNIPTKNQIPSYFHIFTVELSWGRERGSRVAEGDGVTWETIDWIILAMPSQIKHKKWSCQGVGQCVHVTTETRGSRCSTVAMTWFTRPHKSRGLKKRQHRPEFVFCSPL